MKRRPVLGLVLAALFTLGNVAGGVYAAAMGEMRHAGLHVVLTLVGAWLTWQLARRRRDRGVAAETDAAADGSPRELASRLTDLEQSLDAIAVEVERVGEGQRFMTRLFTEQGERQQGKK
jgi:hypothetical protein